MLNGLSSTEFNLSKKSEGSHGVCSESQCPLLDHSLTGISDAKDAEGRKPNALALRPVDSV
jgi:hypothetical protein